MLSATISTLCIATTNVTALGRHHKRGGAAFGHATSFVVSFVVAMHRVDVVALNTIFALVVHYFVCRSLPLCGLSGAVGSL